MKRKPAWLRKGRLAPKGLVGRSTLSFTPEAKQFLDGVQPQLPMSLDEFAKRARQFQRVNRKS